MKEKDKIYELFRENEHKLDQKPSRRAWERVDARLDRHYAKRQSPAWFKYGGMVAATLILAFTASMLVMDSSGDKTSQFADNSDSVAEESFALMDLSMDGDIDNHMRIVAYQNEYKNRANRISERSVAGNLQPRGRKKITKKLESEVVANGDATIAEAVTEDIEENKVAEARFDDIDQSIDLKEIAMNMVTIAEPEVLEEEIVKEKKKDYKETEKTEFIDEEEVAVEMVDNTVEVTAPAAIASSKTTSVAPAAPSKGNANYAVDISVKEEAAADKSTEDTASGVSYDVNADEGAYVGMEEEKEELSLAEDFSWLLGKWKGKVKGSTSKEVWSKVNASTYKGKGILIAGGTTLFSEKLELRITDVGTYLTITLDKKKKRVAYRMTSNNGYTIVFANNSVDFPKKIILTKKSDDSYSIVMQAGDTESLDNDQIMYLENRNDIQGAKMIRSFRKDD